MWGRAVGVAVFLAGTAAAALPAGHYVLAGGPDTVSELVLQPDGHFRYMLAAGALDEHAEGRWTSDGKQVRLTTMPKPVAPVIAVGKATKTVETPLKIDVTGPDGHGLALIEIRVEFDKGEPVEDVTQDYGWSLSSDEKRTPRFIDVGAPAFGLKSQRFPVDAAKANALVFVVTPNDIGTVDFENEALDIRPGTLVMHRHGSDLVYEASGAKR